VQAHLMEDENVVFRSVVFPVTDDYCLLAGGRKECHLVMNLSIVRVHELMAVG